MGVRILHLLDHTTTADAMMVLAPLLARPRGDRGSSAVGWGGMHRVVGMGNRGTGIVAAEAGIDTNLMEWVPSLGWADPAGWRATRRCIEEFSPTHVHAWGMSAVVATAVSGFAGMRVATFAEAPGKGALRLLRIIDGRSGAGSAGWRWVGAAAAIARKLQAAGLSGARVFCVRPGVRLGGAGKDVDVGAVKKSLGISTTDGPVILLGGEGARARHDFGLWAGAILQQIFPRTRVVVRDDPRGRVDAGLERLKGSLPEDGMLSIAPAERTWPELLKAADIFLVTPDGPMQTGTILQAMAMGVPVIGTPVECVTELIAHGHTGLLAKAVKPRMIAARLEEFMNDATLRWPLIDKARATVYEEYKPSAMLEAYAGLYVGESSAAVTAAVTVGAGS